MWGWWRDVAVTLKGTLCTVQLLMLHVGMVAGCSSNSEGYALYSPVTDASCGDGGGM